MNKSFKKIAAAFVGMAMAIGVGVAVGNDAREARAEDANLTAGTNGGSAEVVVGESTYPAVKVGTSKLGGDMKVTVGAKANSLEFYAAAWKGVTGLSLNISGVTADPASVDLTANDGMTNNSPFTLSGDAENHKFTVALSGVTDETEIVFTTSIAKRFVIWGATYTVEEGGGGDVPADASVASVAIEGAPAETVANARVGDTIELSASATLRSGEGTPTFSWESDNAAVAKVSSTGVVTLYGNGTANITATASFPAGSEEGDTNVGSVAITVDNLSGSINNPYSVAEARAAIDSGVAKAKENVYATGIVSEIVTPFNETFGNISYNFSEDGSTTADQLQAYRGFSYEGAHFESEDDIKVGDTVVVKGNLTVYKTTYEFAAENQLVSKVDRSVTGISVTAPTKTSYKLGVDKELDLTGMVVTVTYTGGSQEAITEGYTVSEVDFSTYGQKEVTVSVGDLSDTFNITVVKPLPLTYYVIDRATYDLAEGALDLEASVLPESAFRGDEVTLKAAPAEGWVVLGMTVGEEDFEGGEATFTMAYGIEEVYIVVLQSCYVYDHLEVVAPTKINYRPGEELDLTGMEVYQVALDGTKYPVSEEDYTVTAPDMSTSGTKVVTVSIADPEDSTTFNVYVISPLPLTYVAMDVNTYEEAEGALDLEASVLPESAFRGDEVTIKAVAAEGWEVLGIYASEEVDVEGNEVTFTMAYGISEVTIAVRPVQAEGFPIVWAMFDWNTFEASYDFADYVDMEASVLPTSAAIGEEVSVKFVMKEGWQFGGAFDEAFELYEDEPEFTFVMPEVEEGEAYTILFYADSIWPELFFDMPLDGFVLATTGEYSFLDPAEVYGEGSILPVHVEEGQEVTVHFEAAEGYIYLGWRTIFAAYEGETLPSDFFDQFEEYEGTEDTLTFVMPEVAIQIVPVFVAEEDYNKPVVMIASGQQKEFMINDEFSFGNGVISVLAMSGESTVNVEDVTFSEVDMTKAGKQTVTITYGELTYSYEIVIHDPHAIAVQADAGAHVTFVSTTETTADPGEIVRFTVRMDDNYSLDAVAVLTASGAEVTVSKDTNQMGGVSYSFEMPAEDVTVYVSTIDEIAVAKDRAKANLLTYYTQKDKTQYTDAGLQALLAAKDAGDLAIEAATTMEGIDEALANAKAALDAIETKPTHAINKVAGEGATIVLGTPEAMAEGGQVRFGIEIADGYEVVSYKVTTASGQELEVEEQTSPISTKPTYVFTMPAEEVTITVTTRNPLAEAKEAAIEQLEAFVAQIDMSKYDQAGKDAIAAAVQAGKDAINACTSVNELAALVQAAEDAINQVAPYVPAPAKKGCGGSIAATSVILSVLALAGMGLVAFKKKED